MITLEINIYKFEELNESAKNKAIEEHRIFLESLPVELENESGEIEEFYDMEYTDSEIIDNIIANEYLFHYNGDLTSSVTYVGNHIKSGITEITIKGFTYTV